MNTMKSFILLAALTALLIFLGGALGGRAGLMLMLLFAGIMNFGAYWYSDKIVLSMHNAKQVQASDGIVLYDIVKELSQKAGLPMPKVYLINDETPNAFATGRNPEHAAVAATSGIMRILDRDELEGVMAHELAHVLHRDTLTGTIAATIAGAISGVANLAMFASMFGGSNNNDGEGNGFGGLILALLAPIAASLIQFAISRSREYAADEGGARISGKPQALANALKKLEMANQSHPMQASEQHAASAHLFIVNPLHGRSLAKLFSTHPPIEDRVRRLEQMT